MKLLSCLLALTLAGAAPSSALAQTLGRAVAPAPSLSVPVAPPGSIGSRLSGLNTAPSLSTLNSLPGLSAPAAAPKPSSPIQVQTQAAVPIAAPQQLTPSLRIEQKAGAVAVNGVEVPTAAQVGNMESGQAKESGDAVMDAVLGLKSRPSAGAVEVDASPSVTPSGLSAPEASSPAHPAVPSVQPRASERPSFFAALARAVRSLFSQPVVYGLRILHLHYPHRAWDRIAGDMAADDKTKATNGEHPVGALREILNRTGWSPDNPAGLSISFTPALMEIARRLWGMSWTQRWREAIGWRTASGAPRMEMLLTGFHFLYGLLPWGQAADALVRWNVQYHQLLMKEFWGDPAPKQMKIFRPPEVGFSPEMVPALVKAGVQVVIVDSHHISRALKGYDASGMPNLPPPNKADQRNQSPYPANYYTSGKDGRNTKDVVPYSLLPHWLRYTDPSDGKEYKIIVFPMTGGPSYISGYQDFPNEVVQDIAKFAAQGRPLVMGLDTDGDNAWGGGYSSYMESMPRLAHWMDTNGHQFGTVQEYLTRFPVPADDVIDWVEPGAWPNADWGTPQLTRWLWPPVKMQGVPKPEFDPSAWNFKLQFHALLTMAVHWLLQGEAAMKKAVPGWELDMARVVKADTAPDATPLEKAVQLVLRSFDSGHVYYGTEPEFLHIPVLAAKAAQDAARALMGQDASHIPPTIWGPSRFPWNPGGENRGEVYGWRSHVYGPEFDAYGFVYAGAGLKRVELKWRAASDGRTSPGAENLSYGEAAGAWNSAKMELKDPYPQAEWSGLPQKDRVQELPRMAHARVSPGTEKLVDYFIEAEDAQGRIQRSPIMHAFVGRQ